MILFTGFILRIIYFLKPRSFWGDEWFTIFLSQKPFKEVLLGSIRDVHPPLQFVLYYFGGYRFLPFLAGILSLYFFHKLSKDKLATFLFAISPYFIHLSGEARGYGFLCLFLILALLGYKWAFPCALFTEHYSWFLLLAIPFSIWFLPFLAGSIGLIAYQTQAEEVFAIERFQWSVFGLVKKISGLFIQFGGGVGYSFLTKSQAILLIRKVYLLAFIGPIVFLFYARNKKYLKLFFIPLAVLLIFYPIRLNARYLPFCGISYILLITEGFQTMRKKYNKLALSILICFIAANIFSLAWMHKINYDPYHREDYIGASEYIKKNYKPGEGLIGCREQVQYYLKENFPEKGDAIWEVYLGNLDMRVNNERMHLQEVELKRKATLSKKFGDLVWVIKYE